MVLQILHSACGSVYGDKVAAPSMVTKGGSVLQTVLPRQRPERR